MVKPGRKRPDVLRKTSSVIGPQIGSYRVQKKYARRADDKTLPPWFKRLCDLQNRETRDLKPSDFEEDLSDMSEGELTAWEQKRNEPCYCICHSGCKKCEIGNCDCKCTCESACLLNKVAKETLDAEDAVQFVEMKTMRDRLKIERARKRRKNELEQESSMKLNSERVQEVNVAYRILSVLEKQLRGSGAKMDKISWPAGRSASSKRSYTLFSTMHERHCYRRHSAKMYLEFERMQDEDTLTPDAESSEPVGRLMAGNIWGCKFRPFRPPKRVSSSGIVVETCEGRYRLRFRFLGDGYIKVRVPREVVLLQDGQPSNPQDCQYYPAAFNYVGIDSEKLELERQRLQEEYIEKQSNSPKPPLISPAVPPSDGFG